MKKLYILSACAVLLSPVQTVAQAEEWVTISETSSGTIWKIHIRNLMNENNYNPETWIILDHSKDKTVAHRQSKMLVSINCSANTFTFLNITLYRSDGTVISSETFQDYQRTIEYVPPGTMIESVVELSCPEKK